MYSVALLEASESPSRSNPWASSSSFVKLGTLQNVVSLAERTGHLQKDSHTSQDAQRKVLNAPSVQMISILREITKTGYALDKVNREIQKLLRDNETQDITNVDLIGTRAHRLEKISLHLSSIIDKKDDLIARLQQPFVGEYLTIDSAHHYAASSTLPMIASHLASLPDHLDDITWANDFSLKDGQLDKILSGLEASFIDLQNYFRSLTKGRKVMQQLQKSRSSQD